MVNNYRLDLFSPRVLKITVRHPVCTWRCCTLPLLSFERERMQLVYEFILLNKILRNRLLSEHLQWNYASFNVKSNRLTSISFNKFIRVPKYFICGHSSHVLPPHWNNPVLFSCTITEFCVIGWHLSLSASKEKKYCQTLGYKPNPSIPQAIFNVFF